MTEQDLNERQRDILHYLVSSFIVNAAPVASRYIAKHHDIRLSAATIRNTLSDLEEMGYVSHPHTSAGRIPTDKGYRFFVDCLMEIEPLSLKEQSDIKRQLDIVNQPEELFRQAAKLLGTITHQLSIVSSPHLRGAVLEHLELVSVSSNKILVVLSVRSGIVKTVSLEVLVEILHEHLKGVERLLNERLCGLTLDQIRKTFSDRMKDYQNERSGLIELFIRSADKIFDDTKESEKLHIGGTQSLAEQPEYTNIENFRTIIELINNEGVLVEVLERPESKTGYNDVMISIGEEHADSKLQNYSIIVSSYKAGDVVGKIGIIGPKRMQYAKVIPLINYLAQEVSSSLS